MKRKLLDDIFVASENRPDLWNENDNRQQRWEEERKIYGFDEREIWCFDLTFCTWLYERVKYYYDFAPVDLERHTLEYKNQVLTQKECIEKILLGCKLYLSNPEGTFTEEESAAIDDIAYLWATVLPVMWC